jgi:hypothetical protein
MSNEQPGRGSVGDNRTGTDPSNDDPVTGDRPAAEQRDGDQRDGDQRDGDRENGSSEASTTPREEDPGRRAQTQTNDAGDRDDQPPPQQPETDSAATERADKSSSARPPVVGDDAADSSGETLFSAENGEKLRAQWDAAQTAFVDDPRAAVERADHLVVETIQILSTSFTQERSRLEEQWARGESVSTEDLRVALQLYRTFFERLLSI